MSPGKFTKYMVVAGAGTNVKFARFTDGEVRAHFLGVLSVASRAPIRGCLLVGDQEADAVEVALEAGVPQKVALSALRKLRVLGILTFDDDLGCWRVHDWDEINPKPKKDGSNAARQARYRLRRDSGNATGNALRNVPGNAPSNGAVTAAPSREGAGARSGAPGSPEGGVPEGTEENPSGSKNASHSRPRSTELAVSPNVQRLCELLSELTRHRLGLPASSPKYTVTKEWRTDMRLLVEKDRAHVSDPVAEVEAAIRWVDRNDFWHRQILSPGKLREKYDQLVLAAKERKPQPSPVTSARDARFAEREAAAARVIAQREGAPA